MIAVERQLYLLRNKVDNIESLLSKMVDNEEDRLRDIKWASWYCDVSESTVRRWIRERSFPFLKPDGNNSQLKFTKREIDRWTKEN